MKKLRDDRGETLVEVLASILIASLSVALLFGCVMASSGMDRRARELDGKHYEALTKAEKQETQLDSGTPPKVNIKQVVTDGGYAEEGDISVHIYGGEGIYSYKRAGT